MNDMIEEVKQGLQCCRKHGTLSGQDCNGHYERYTEDGQSIALIDEYRSKCPYGKVKTGCVVTLIDDALSVIESLQWENKIITENITEIDKQRSEIALRWEKLRLENKRLKEQKSVEPKTGHWICGKYDDIFMCSSCEKYSRDDYPYCHWCGAKMKQDGDGE